MRELTAKLMEQLGIDPAAASGPGGIAAALHARIKDPVLSAVASAMMTQESTAEADPEDRVRRRLHERAIAAEEVLRAAAGILGACRACLGLRRACPACRGRGAPGSARPRVEALRSWLRPAYEAAGLDVP